VVVRHGRARRWRAIPDPVAETGKVAMTTHDGEASTRRYVVARSAIASETSTDTRDGPVGALDRVCRALTTYLSVTGAAVNLMSDAGSHGVAAASDARSRALDELQFTTGEGPCNDAFIARRPLLTPDLTSRSAGRWPGYTSAALDAGVGAVFAFPLQVGGVGFGVLDVFSDRPGSLSTEQEAMTLTFARIATDILLDQQLTTQDGDLEPGLATVLDDRAEIHQAQGMVMVALGVPLAEALVRMRGYAFSNREPLIDLARKIIGGDSPLDR
jgi:hypothetical protein